MAQMAAKPMDTEDMEDIEGSPPGNESDSNPPGAEQTESLPNKQSSPPETLDLQATLLGINSNMSKMAEIFSKMWEPPHFGSTSKDKNRIRKRPRSPSPYSSSSESDSEGEKTDHEPPTKKAPSTHKEDDRISIHAGDDEMRALLSKNRPEPDIAEVQSERANDTQNEASFLQTLAHSLDDSEDTSEAIDGELAEIANKRWGKKLGPDKLKEKLGKYKRPANCTTLTPIRINNEIWTRLNTRKKTADLKVGNIQQCILKVAYANLQMASKLLQLKKPCLNPMIESAVESVAILGHASHELAARRLEQIRPALKQEFAALCSREIPQCGEIFGEDLPKQLRDARETSKINEAFYNNTAYTSSCAYNKAKYKNGTYQNNKIANKGDKKQVFHRGKQNSFRKKRYSQQQGQRY